MNIVLEGFDGTGKSTLAQFLSKHLEKRLMHSNGPEHFPGELVDRAETFLRQRDIICDRHPCVSEEVYCVIRGGQSKLPAHLIEQFYAQENILIYCHREGDHVPRPEEDPNHLKSLITNSTILRERYRKWALDRATMIYRYGDNPYTILNACWGILKGVH